MGILPSMNARDKNDPLFSPETALCPPHPPTCFSCMRSPIRADQTRPDQSVALAVSRSFLPPSPPPSSALLPAPVCCLLLLLRLLLLSVTSALASEKSKT